MASRRGLQLLHPVTYVVLIPWLLFGVAANTFVAQILLVVALECVVKVKNYATQS